jgi:hypothetical protein
VLPGLQNFPGIPGRPSAYRWHMFAYLRQVVGIDAVIVAFDKECLAATDSVIVTCTNDRMMQLLCEEPSVELLGPLPATEANIHTITTSL